MDLQNALTELEELAKKLDVDVVYDRFTGDGMGPGGMCKIKGRWRIIIERRCSPSEKVSILINSLRRFDLEAHFLSPGLRELVGRVRGAAAEEPAGAGQSPPAGEPQVDATSPAADRPAQEVASEPQADAASPEGEDSAR